MNPSPAPNHVSDLEHHVGFWLRFVSNHVSEQFRKLVEQNGVSVSEWVALREMYRHEQSSAADLMQALGMTKGAVSKIVTRLQAKGLAARAPDSLDKRAQQLVLTVPGRDLVPRLAGLADRNDEHFFGTLSDAQRATLVGIMRQVVHDRQLRQVPVE